jgi:hypothetical protein
MLRSSSAVRSLQDGCRRLGLPSKTAVGLVDFLSVKHLHDRIKDGQGLRMSPGTALDRLWHWMLLNTAGGAFNTFFELYTYGSQHESILCYFMSVTRDNTQLLTFGTAASAAVHAVYTCVLQCPHKCTTSWVVSWSIAAPTKTTCQTPRSCCSACTA